MIDPHIEEGPSAVTDKTLRQFAVLSVVIFGGLAIWHGVVHHRVVLGTLLGAAGTYIGVAGIASLGQVRSIYTALMAVTFPIGQVVSAILLAVLFYGLFLPIGLLFKIFGRDALTVRRPTRDSHWEAKPRPTDVRSYLRQS